jgi:hypothetical protein
MHSKGVGHFYLHWVILHKIAISNENILVLYQLEVDQIFQDFYQFHKLEGSAFVVSDIDFWFQNVCVDELLRMKSVTSINFISRSLFCSLSRKVAFAVCYFVLFMNQQYGAKKK